MPPVTSTSSSPEPSTRSCPSHESQIAAGVQAWRRFGKGRHSAGLNFGDCFAYALSRARDVPLLFAGEDFAQTDLPSVRP